MTKLAALAMALGLAIATPTSAQIKWDMPTAYPANNFHTENIVQFVSVTVVSTSGSTAIFQASPLVLDFSQVPRGGTPAEFAAFLAKDSQAWGQVVARNNIRID